MVRQWLKKIWHDPVGSKVIASVIVGVPAVAFVVVAYLRNWWPTIVELLSYLTRTTPVPNWLLAALIALSMLTLIQATLSIRKPREPWRKYTEDRFDDYWWRWDYTAEGEPTDLRGYCTNCDYEITDYASNWSDGWTTERAGCPHCDKLSTPLGERHEVHGAIERLIQKYIRTGEWKEHISKHR